MSQWKDRKEGRSSFKTSQSDEDGTRSLSPKPLEGQESEPGSSCVSIKSDQSMRKPVDLRGHQSVYEKVRSFEHQMDLDSIFMQLEKKLFNFMRQELNRMKRILSPETSKNPKEEEVMKTEDEQRSRESFLMITLHFLRSMKQEELADCLQSKLLTSSWQRKHKFNLKKKFQCVFEGVAKAGNPALLNQVYTELYITKGGTGGVSEEHEVRLIEAAFRKPDGPEAAIRHEDIFKPPPGREEPIRTVVTKGVAGIGKTVLTQKFTLDWAEEKTNHNIQLMFPFTFRELNVLKNKKFSLVELVHHFFSETKEICRFEDFQVVFIFDGLDECRLPLDFHNNEVLTDVTESTSVDVLLTNLIRGNLLPSARLWITTRPAAANQIPSECVGMVTEIRGFTDPQKEEYFQKRFKEKQANKIIAHIRTSQSLHIMCHIPVFCWITATVLEDVLKTIGGKIPKTLTEMYIHFLVVQTKVKQLKYAGGAETDPLWNPENKKIIESLGKLAFDHLQKGNLIFYESDLTECGIDIPAASVYSGVFTQIFKEERGFHQDKVFCFVHLSVQEFLAALHVHLTFINSGVNLLVEQQISSKTSKEPDLNYLNQCAVYRAFQSPNGHLDLFLRFLLGLSLPANQTLLRGLFTQTVTGFQTNQKTIQYIKKMISEHLSPERSINLFHCLNELNDSSLVEEVQRSLKSGGLSTDNLSPAEWSALVFVLLTSKKDLDVFDLNKYSASEMVLLRLLPVVRNSVRALLRSCNLSETSCEALASVLKSQSSCLRELDLSNNDLKDAGVKLLSLGLKSPQCELEAVCLSGCLVKEEGCASLSSVLSSPHSSLKELDLSHNELHDSGVKALAAGLRSPDSKLETLSLADCLISEESCAPMALALRSQFLNLRNLNLNNNNLQDSGVGLLTAALMSQHSRLETLSLAGCLITEEACVFLASILSYRFSNLRKLDVSNNDLRDPGVRLLSEGLMSQHSKLETLNLAVCLISEEVCDSLASVLSSQFSNLRELDLSNNDLRDSGVKRLSAGLRSAHSQIRALRLAGCLITKESCSSLASALNSRRSHLRHLDLQNNDLLDSGVKLLCAGLKSPHSKLEHLSLSGCLVTEEGCAALASALKLNSSYLTELDLSYNHPRDLGIRLLSAGRDDPQCSLETLRMENGGAQRLNPGLWKYFCDLQLNLDTMNRNLELYNNNRTVMRGKVKQLYPDHPDRFVLHHQLLCRNSLTGRCYWEVEWRGEVSVSVSYRGIRRREVGDDCRFGGNGQSWSLECSESRGYCVWHNKNRTPVSSSSVTDRVAVYVDCPAGTLSFHKVHSDALIHLHTFNTTFTEPLYPGFGFWSPGSSVSLSM